MRLDDGDGAWATCTAMTCNGAVPKAFDMRTRMVGPPTERRTTWRSVASRRLSGGSALRGSGSCCDVDHDASHSTSADAGQATVTSMSNENKRSARMPLRILKCLPLAGASKG